MSIGNFPFDVWALHRKLHHRFLRFYHIIQDITEELPEFKKAMEEKEERPRSKSSTEPCQTQTVCLMSDSNSSEGSMFYDSEEEDDAE